MNLFQRLRDALGLSEEYDEEYYYDEEEPAQDPYAPREENPPSPRKKLPSNVIGLHGIAMEMILMQPRSFDEIPDAVTALRERKAVILNLNLMEIEQAQRCADYVAGGAFAIDGHQRQIGENVFLFTPNFVQISNYPIPDSMTQQPPSQYTPPTSPWTPQPK
ncbi:MAG: cell division protein SepF [Cyanobacteria bacterium CRU_2_1]|nr:cell division protein SepF [Cyanobacteria bacterium RU_5_0]NJR61052.1 cell division protein SepF [Cyanobacteria bacterium CRU_2_1]